MGNLRFRKGSNYSSTVSDQNPLAVSSGYRLDASVVCSFDAGATSSSVVTVPNGYRLARIEASTTWLERDVSFKGSISDEGVYRDANDMAGELISMKVKPGALCYVAPVEGAMIGASPQMKLTIATAQVEAQTLKLWFVAI